ncbi:glycosyltransferase family 4 protein [Alphaproteobacteria bacterium]|nr:glycosyltransferase family 4 protein [Alphaproteobacteria bacterium]
MKLLLVINHIDWFWSHRLPLALAAKQAGYDVHVAVHGASWDPRFEKNGFTGHELPQSGVVSAIHALRKIIKKEKPTIVHAITLKTAFITGLAGKFMRDVRFVHTIAGLGYLFSEGKKPRLMRRLVKPFMVSALKNSKLIFQNPDDLRLLIRRSFVATGQCNLVRGSGVDTEEFAFIPEPAGDVPLVIMPTRLVHDKGIAVFVEAAQLLKARGVKAKFQIAGGVTDNNPNAISKDQMEFMVADGAVEWLGKVADMPALFTACNLVVYPSYYGEGIPKVLLEAAATGRAIVTTDHPGCREAVTNGVNGLLVPVKDAEALADATELLLLDQGRREKMGTASREKAVAEFDVKKINAETLRVYG